MSELVQLLDPKTQIANDPSRCFSRALAGSATVTQAQKSFSESPLIVMCNNRYHFTHNK
jgi:hypothetical protein